MISLLGTKYTILYKNRFNICIYKCSNSNHLATKNGLKARCLKNTRKLSYEMEPFLLIRKIRGKFYLCV